MRISSGKIREIDLYGPVKGYLESLGYRVKGEIGSCDLVGLGDDGRLLVIGELKLSFTLELVLQAVDRMGAADEVWLAVQIGGTRQRDHRVRKLCRLLGFGLLCVGSQGAVAVLVAPGSYRPRADLRRRSSLVMEHRKRAGDPMAGGGTRRPILTAYRQQALTCARALLTAPQRPRDLRSQSPDAPKILLRNVYGWFERIERGLYALTASGRAALGSSTDLDKVGAQLGETGRPDDSRQEGKPALNSVRIAHAIAGSAGHLQKDSVDILYPAARGLST